MNRGEKYALVIAFTVALAVHAVLAAVNFSAAFSMPALEGRSSDTLRISFALPESTDEAPAEGSVPEPADPAPKMEEHVHDPVFPRIDAPDPTPEPLEKPLTRSEPAQSASPESFEPDREGAQKKEIEKKRQDRVSSATPETEQVVPGTGFFHPDAEEEPTEEPVVPAVPRYRDNPPPRYPAAALRRGQEGTVLLSVTVGVDGTPREVALKESSGYDILDRSAMASVRSWRFDPATRRGIAFEIAVEVPVRFELKNDRW